MAMKVEESREFRIQYKVKPTDSAINMRLKTTSLEQVHKILCGMNGFRLPLSKWHEIVCHEQEEYGNVLEWTHTYLANCYDHLYEFKGEQVVKEGSSSLGTRLTRVVVVGKGKRRLLSTSNFLDRRECYVG